MSSAAARRHGRATRQRLANLPWRKLFAGGAAAAIVVVALAVGAGAWIYSRARTSNVGELDSADELAIPPLAKPTIAADGTKVFDLRFTAGESHLVDDGPSETWGLDGDGSLDTGTPLFELVGILGDTIVVNGTTEPHLDVTTERVPFRVLNASNGRVYNLGFPDGRRFWQVASDAGLLERPHETDRLQRSPGERAEIVVEMAPGDETVLRSFAPDLGVGFADRFAGGDDTFDIIELRAAAELVPSPEVPDELATIDRPDPDHAVTTRSFSLGGSRINDQRMDMDRVDEVVTVGTTEIWEVTNDHGSPHSFHPHLVHFAVLEIDGEAPPPELAGWEDTIYVPPDTTVRLIALFDDHADPTTPYMFHCHILRHEDQGMMGQFVVVEPGDEPDLSGMDSTPGHHH